MYYLGDFLHGDSSDFAIVDALETIGLVEEVAADQVGEVDLEIGIAQIHNLRPDIIFVSAAACRPNHTDPAIAVGLLSHTKLMGAVSVSVLLGCDQDGHRSPIAKALWGATRVLVDYFGDEASSDWNLAGAHVEWFGRGVHSSLCDETLRTSLEDSPKVPACLAAPAASQGGHAQPQPRARVGNEDWGCCCNPDPGEISIILVSYPTVGGGKGLQGTAAFLQRRFGRRFSQLEYNYMRRDAPLREVVFASHCGFASMRSNEIGQLGRSILVVPSVVGSAAAGGGGALVAMEAAASGYTVLCGDDGGVEAVRELVNGTHCLVYRSDDLEGLGRLVDYYSARWEEAAEWATAAHMAVCAELSWEGKVSQVLQELAPGAEAQGSHVCTRYEAHVCHEHNKDLSLASLSTFNQDLLPGQRPGQVYLDPPTLASYTFLHPVPVPVTTFPGTVSGQSAASGKDAAGPTSPPCPGGDSEVDSHMRLAPAGAHSQWADVDLGEWIRLPGLQGWHGSILRHSYLDRHGWHLAGPGSPGKPTGWSGPGTGEGGIGPAAGPPGYAHHQLPPLHCLPQDCELIRRRLQYPPLPPPPPTTSPPPPNTATTRRQGAAAAAAAAETDSGGSRSARCRREGIARSHSPLDGWGGAEGALVVALRNVTLVADAQVCNTTHASAAFSYKHAWHPARPAGCLLPQGHPALVEVQRALLLVRYHGWFFGHMIQDLVYRLALAAELMGEDVGWGVIVESNSHTSVRTVIRAVLAGGSEDEGAANLRSRLVFMDTDCLRGNSRECSWYIRAGELLIAEPYPHPPMIDFPFPLGIRVAQTRLRAFLFARHLAALPDPALYGLARTHAHSPTGSGLGFVTPTKTLRRSSFAAQQTCVSEPCTACRVTSRNHSAAPSGHSALAAHTGDAMYADLCYQTDEEAFRRSAGGKRHAARPGRGAGGWCVSGPLGPVAGGSGDGRLPSSVVFARGMRGSCKGRHRCPDNFHQLVQALDWASILVARFGRPPTPPDLTPRSGLDWHTTYWDPKAGDSEQSVYAEAASKEGRWQFRRGVATVNLEARSHTLLEAVALIGQAHLIVSVQGSQTLNAMFARSGTVLVELVPAAGEMELLSNHVAARSFGMRTWLLPMRDSTRSWSPERPMLVEVTRVLRVIYREFTFPPIRAISLRLHSTPAATTGLGQAQGEMGGGRGDRGTVQIRVVEWVALGLDVLHEELCLGVSCLDLVLLVDGFLHARAQVQQHPLCALSGSWALHMLPVGRHELRVSLMVRRRRGHMADWRALRWATGQLPHVVLAPAFYVWQEGDSGPGGKGGGVGEQDARDSDSVRDDDEWANQYGDLRDQSGRDEPSCSVEFSDWKWVQEKEKQAGGDWVEEILLDVMSVPLLVDVQPNGTVYETLND